MIPIASTTSALEFVGAWIRLGIETIGVLIIAAGAVVALAALMRRPAQFTAVRLTLAKYLALALEFQLAADVLETAVTPEWQKIAELAAIATIRTALNYFLRREMIDERREIAAEAASAPG